jgi:DNA-binding Lrp family transcriptional regulator
MQLDEIDRTLIGLLRADARTSVATLAEKLDLARGTVTHRLRRLEDDQIIIDYTVILQPQSKPAHIRAWMGVQVDGNQTREVITNLLGEPAIIALHDTNGRWYFWAELRAAST